MHKYHTSAPFDKLCRRFRRNLTSPLIPWPGLFIAWFVGEYLRVNIMEYFWILGMCLGIGSDVWMCVGCVKDWVCVGYVFA